MHTARIWMALAIPGGAPGYDYNNKLGNFIAHIAARTSQRLRGYSHQAPEVKGDGFLRDLGRVTRFRAFREGEFAGSSYAPDGFDRPHPESLTQKAVSILRAWQGGASGA